MPHHQPATTVMIGLPPSGRAAIPITYSNTGLATGALITLVATLAPSLTYHSDSSIFPPVVRGNTVTWTLPELTFLESRTIILRVNVPNGVIGTHYPITFTLSSSGPDAIPTQSDELAARQVFVPAVMR